VRIDNDRGVCEFGSPHHLPALADHQRGSQPIDSTSRRVSRS
jgi:hypothetical protein